MTPDTSGTPPTDLPSIPDFPTSLEPHELLEIMVGELKNPLDSIEGWARVIAQDNNLEAISLEAADSLPLLTGYARALLLRAERYLQAWRAEQDQRAGQDRRR